MPLCGRAVDISVRYRDRVETVEADREAAVLASEAAVARAEEAEMRAEQAYTQ